MFYAGALYGTKGHSARTYDWGNARHLVQAVLDRYQLNDVIEARKDTFLPRLAPHLRPANPELR